MNIQQIIKENEEEFEKRFGKELDTKDGICENQPCECCDKTSLKINSHLHQSQLHLISAFKEMVEEIGNKHKVPCDCPKGGIIDEERNLVCPKCDGSEWVYPDDINDILSSLTQP